MKKILVVDDDTHVRILLARFLRDRNYAPILASSGAEGFNAAVEHRPDLILLDISMPGMDGVDVLQKLRETEETAKIPVIMLTGVETKEAIRDAMYWYAEQYLVKPVDRDVLAAAMERILTRGRKSGNAVSEESDSGVMAAQLVPALG